MVPQTSFYKTVIGPLALCLFALWTNPVHAKPNMTNITVDANENYLILDAFLKDAFSEKLTEVIESGVPMTFEYKIELLRRVSILADSVVSKNKVVNTVHYDTLKKVFIFTSEGKSVHRKVHTKSLDRYQQLMLTLKNIPVAPLYKLERDEQYYVRVKAEMETDDGLWFPFNYLLFFVPFNEFETAWAESPSLVLDVDPEFPVDDSKTNSPSRKTHPKVLENATRSFSQ